jgi:hypothetical protein
MGLRGNVIGVGMGLRGEGGGFYIHNPMRMIEGERVRCRYTNQFISRCDDLIESVLGEGLCM